MAFRRAPADFDRREWESEQRCALHDVPMFVSRQTKPGEYDTKHHECMWTQWQGRAEGAAVGMGILLMALEIQKNTPRCCDQCGTSHVPLTFGDGIGHAFCSGRCYEQFHG